MAFVRTISQGITDLNAPEMGGAFPSGVNQNPASFNDAVNQIIGIDQLGWVSAQGMGANVGGSYKPLVGDWGNQFTHSNQLILQETVGLPDHFTKFVLIVHGKVIAADHTIACYLTNPATGGIDILMPVSGTTQLGTGPNQHLFSGTLIVPATSGVEDRVLEFRVDKGALGSTLATNNGNKYWDGLWAFNLKFWK